MTYGADEIYRFVFLSGGIVITFFLVSILWSLKWQKFPCKITYYKIHQWKNQNKVYFLPEVVYEYSIGESVFRGTNIDLFGNSTYKNEDDIKQLLDSISLAYVCPFNKSVAYLVPNKKSIYVLFFSAIISFMAAIFMHLIVIH